MTVVRIPPTLRDETGGQAELQARGETVRDLLDDLTGRFPALRERIYTNGDLASFVNVYVGGEDVRRLVTRTLDYWIDMYRPRWKSRLL